MRLMPVNVLQTLEVATARVYNWDVVQKRKEKAEGGGDDEEGEEGKEEGKSEGKGKERSEDG